MITMMQYSVVDIAMQGFYCGSREEFDDLCQRLNRITVGDSRSLPLIEVHRHRPAHFPPVQPYVPTLAAASAVASKCFVQLFTYLNTMIPVYTVSGKKWPPLNKML